ncbi:MAG: glycosyl hydrolase [Fimbriiglobus sp.]|jgi:photosystem II stability/assembly factor-like uncharacterized protein|nr:glycosyl hydrolase [Fimbriiglobus sp.]
MSRGVWVLAGGGLVLVWLLVVAEALMVSSQSGSPIQRWEMLAVPTTAKFRGLSVVSGNVVWASGTSGTVIRTTDGGKTWDVFAVPGAAELDFRDVEAFGPDVAYVLAAGEDDKSRIYKTTDGGKTWHLQFTNPDVAGFLDAIAFWDDKTGLALGDPVNGHFQLFATTDGQTWQRLPNLPEALPDEGAFAASGTCLVTQGERNAWFCTGGPNGARVFRSTDGGATWAASEVPIGVKGKTAGGFSLAFRDVEHGMIVGGDYTKPNEVGANTAITTDGGKTWRRALPLPFRSCVAWEPGTWWAAGTSGIDAFGGQSWQQVDGGNWNAINFRDSVGWAVGPDGRVGKVTR